MSHKNIDMQQKAREFVRKYRNHEFTFRVDGREAKVLAEELAEAIHEFEVVENSTIVNEPEKYPYSNKLQNLNKKIDLAIANNLYQENITLKKLKMYEEKTASFELQLKDSQSVIQQLRDENTALKSRIDVYKKMYPDIKRWETTEEGEVLLDE